MDIRARSIILAALGCLGSISMFGCGLEAAEDGFEEEAIGEAASRLVHGNAISLNAISLNALNLSAINLGALNITEFSPASLSAIQDPGPNGDLARDLVRYATDCALTSSQSFSFSWTDLGGVVHNETIPGKLGVAPSWATGPLDDHGERMVSGCLAARVNYYETPVTISLRSLQEPLKTLVGSQELADYPNIEGAFWGNLFGANPFINSCYRNETVNNSRSYMRDCAIGHLIEGGGVVECGMIQIAGECQSICGNINGAGQFYSSCTEQPGSGSTSTKIVITTALP